MDALRVAICQIDTVVGDLAGNLAAARAAVAEAEAAGADVAVLPEMTITGYPPEDLVLKAGFVADARRALADFAAGTRGCAAVIGFADGAIGPEREATEVEQSSVDRGHVERSDLELPNGAWNAVAVCADGRVHGTYHKRHLPNYGVFDELRHFRPGTEPQVLFEIAGVAVGVILCEDAWIADGPVNQLARGGARLVLNINGSPFRVGKQAVREDVIRRRVQEAGVPVVYANLVGGQDELVFDGGSFVIGADGEIVARCPSFETSVDVVDVALVPPAPTLDRYRLVTVTPARPARRAPLAARVAEPLDTVAERWAALALGTRDYVHKSGFTDICLGLSGGVDSSLVAAVAADAIGAEHVHGVLMPSRHSSEHSVADAEKLAANLGIDVRTVAIEPAHAALLEMLTGSVAGGRVEPGDLTDQNIQSRIRGLVLMALANEHGWLVLTTGNKSEAAVGYTTLYGDTAGAYAVIKDVWKLDVYELCRWRNRRVGRELVPETVLTKAPSAELRPNQRDDDSLPPYEVLDPVLRAYVEGDHTLGEIVSMGLADPEIAARVCDLVDRAEFKRRQSPMGPRVSRKAFGRDRRMPTVNLYRG
ncbi:MAG: NAD+ synthase [Acidimicrobiales bacterium]